MGVVQQAQDVAAVGHQIGHHRRAQVGIHGHQLTGRTLGFQPRQIDLGVLGVQRQAPRADPLQTGHQSGVASGVELGGIDLAVGHARAVKSIVGVARSVQGHHRQGGRLGNGFGMAQQHPVVQHLLAQGAAKTVFGKGVEVQGAQALQAQSPAQVVNSAPQAGLKGTVRSGNQINQRLAGHGDLHRGKGTHGVLNRKGQSGRFRADRSICAVARWWPAPGVLRCGLGGFAASNRSWRVRPIQSIGAPWSVAGGSGRRLRCRHSPPR